MEEINQYMPLSHDWNKERLETIKTMFPDIFTSEGKLNIDELKKLIDPRDINETERYEFRWFGKSQAKRNAFTPSNATLVYDEKRSLNPDKADNLIIEGENLEVLKLLSGAYREKIKCIYIDPPYNTGKDFVYSDNFTQDKKGYWEDAGITEEGVKVDTNTEADGRYHSNWLNMMYSRLLVARALLKPDGVIFISIDDNEVHNLRKVCDEVFGEDNLVSQIPWQARQSIQNDTDISDSHEYIVVYAKNRRQENRRLKETNKEIWFKESTFAFYPKDLDSSKFSNPDNDPRGIWKADPFDAPNVRENLTYPIQNPNTGEVYYPPQGRHWRTEQDKFEKLLEDNRIVFGKTGDSKPQLKVFYNEKLEFGSVIDTWFDGDTYGTATKGTKTMQKIFDGVSPFDTVKPVELIYSLIKYSTTKDDFILDFFGGSGTTAQAVMELNQEDEGKRKFILVQIPEATDNKSDAYKSGYRKISDITIERNKRVVERILEQKKTQQLDAFKDSQSENGLGFKVFKLSKSNFPRTEWTPEPDKTEAENIEALKKYILEKEAQLITMFNRQELTTEILLKKGFNLNYKTEKQEQFQDNNIYLASDGEKEVLICLDAIMHDNTVEYFKTNTKQKFICLERALDTTKKWNLKHYLGDKLNAV